MEPIIVYAMYLWYKAKEVFAAMFLSGCLTYGVECYNPAYFTGEEDGN